jgi:DNA (cytosine-5)-methyltransferase 1
MVVPQKVGNKYYVRSMTPDELKIIQGFPSDYILHGNQSDKVTQVGNAVPPILVKDIVCWLINKHG